MAAEGNYTTFYFTDGLRHMACKNLGYYEAILPECFARPHRSYIVNLHYLYGINSHNVLQMQFDTPECVVLTCDYRPEFERRHDRWLIKHNETE